MTTNQYDVVIVGGGAGGLSAALALGRARRRVLLCDAGPRRNAAATHMHNFLTRDGTPPAEVRRIGREHLATYPTVTVRDACVDSIGGTAGAFDLVVAGEPVTAKRILHATGMIDERLPIPGFNELDEIGYVKVDPMSRETSIKGIYASGDLSTRMQAAILAAASGMQTAAMVNVDLAMS
jgi:thioredoxin reductase